jgi:hypothetical protein
MVWGAADIGDDGAGEASVVDPPVKNDVTRLVNELSEDAAGGVVAAGAPPLVVVPLSDEHAASVAATVAAPAAGRQMRRSVFIGAVRGFVSGGGTGGADRGLRLVAAVMRKPCQSGDLHAARAGNLGAVRKSDSLSTR